LKNYTAEVYEVIQGGQAFSVLESYLYSISPINRETIWPFITAHMLLDLQWGYVLINPL
jgi:hypothetical protein